MRAGGVNPLKNREFISLGGLLHDIGKFVQRAEGKKSRQKEFFEYAHAELSYELTEEFLKRASIFKEEDQKLILSACFHHKPDTKHPEADEKLFPVRALFRLADWYASVERSSLLDKESEEHFKRLKPVFQKVDAGKGTSEGEFIYKLVPLTLEEGSDGYPLIFPQSVEEVREYVSDKESELYGELYGRYEDLYRDFKYYLFNKKHTAESQVLNFVYHLLYKYTWCVPASIYDREKYHSHYPDISLFDHSRVVSALASSLYSEQNLKILEEFRDSRRREFAEKLRLVIFEGDISGIQKFLYDITNIKGVAKRLRGRSVFMSFLPELVGRFILEKLGYPWINILYAGGGKFQAVIGYEDGIHKKLKNLSRKVEEVLIRTFGGKLGFVVYSQDFKLSELENYAEIVKSLMDKSVEEKKRKFALTIENFESLANKQLDGNTRICPSCRNELIRETEEEEITCQICEDFKVFGDAVVKSRYVIFSKEKLEKGISGGFYLDRIGGIYLTDKVKAPFPSSEVYLINRPEDFEKDSFAVGFRFLANVVPEDKEGVKSFEEMAEEIEEGDKKLAFVMADVDNLGFIFMRGLGKNYTISRVATLSRSLDLFFSGYLNRLFGKTQYKGKIYTLYAGGDDLFIVSPWDTALKAMTDVRKHFRDFTCHNPSFGLSCGVYTAGGTYPVRLAYEGVKRAEDKAKNSEGKDSICALDEVLRWNELEGSFKEAEEVIEKIGKGELGRTNFYRIYLMLREYRELENAKNDKRFMFYPFFYYYLSRNVKEEHRRFLEDIFIDTAKDHSVRNRALFLAKYILMKTRNVR